MNLLHETAALSLEKINYWAEKSYQIVKANTNLDRNSIRRIQLTIDEILLRCRDTYGDSALCTLQVRKWMGRIHITCTVPGPEQNPLISGEDSLESNYNILTTLGLTPYHYYSAGKNIIRFTAKTKKEKSFFNLMLIAFFLAVISGIILRFLPDTVTSVVCSGLFTPVFNKLIKIFSAAASPLIFMAILLSVQSMGDVQALGRIGKKFLSATGTGYLLAVVVTAAINIPFYPFTSGVSKGESGFSAIVKMTLDIIPDNLFAPFSEGNDMQIVVIAIALGVVVLMVREKIPDAVRLLEQVNKIIQQLMLLICKLLPVIIYLSLTTMIADDSISQMGSLYKPMLLFFAGSAVLTGSIFIRALIITKAKPGVILRKHFDTFLINISTSSAVTSYPTSSECCKKRFGVDEKLVDFALPFGMVAYMPNGSLYLAVVTIYLANMFGVAITPMWLINLLLITFVIAVAAPPIPGSAFVVISVLLTSMSVPLEALPVAVILNTICGYFLPALNIFCLQMETLISAEKLHMLDKDVLNAPLTT